MSGVSSLSLGDWASLATVVTGFSAVLAVAFALWQTRQFRWNQLETLARDQYQHFLELCVSYPQFASPESNVDVAALTFVGDHDKFVQYEWFFTAGCNSLEAIYAAVGMQKHWRQTIVSILEEHKEYVLSQRYVEIQRPTGDPEFEGFVDAVLHRASSSRRKVGRVTEPVT